MSCHKHLKGSCSRKKSTSALKRTLILVLFFMLIEFIFGWIAHSLALITDALHLFTDAGAVCLSLFAFWMAKRPATKRLTYGYHRAEIIAALVSGGATWALSGFLIYEGIKRLITPHNVNGPIVLIVASIGLIANLIMMKILHPTKGDSLNVKGVYIHILGDLLASFGVLIAGLLITLTHWNPIDPIVTFIIAIMVIRSAWKLIKETLMVLMEAAPVGLDLGEIEKDLKAIKSVDAVHDLHVWMVSQNQTNLSVHLCSGSPTEALKEAGLLIQDKYHIEHTTIQVEPSNDYLCKSCHFHA